MRLSLEEKAIAWTMFAAAEVGRGAKPNAAAITADRLIVALDDRVEQWDRERIAGEKLRRDVAEIAR